MPSAPSGVTLDLWHTLVYLPPDAEERYMDQQMELAATVLYDAPGLPGAPSHPRPELRRIFEGVYAEAVRSAHDGRSVPPAAQLVRAAGLAGRVARPDNYLAGLERLLAATPFQTGPHALSVVRALAEGGRRTAVISNTVGEPGAMFRPILRSLGFDGSIGEYVFSDELPWTKPDPAIFREALRRLGVDPQRAVHVGDGWSDIEGARRASLRAGILFTGLQQYGARYQALFLPPGWSAPPSEYRLDSLEGLPALVDRLLGPARS